jgi:hypothetical protein
MIIILCLQTWHFTESVGCKVQASLVPQTKLISDIEFYIVLYDLYRDINWYGHRMNASHLNIKAFYLWRRFQSLFFITQSKMTPWVRSTLTRLSRFEKLIKVFLTMLLTQNLRSNAKCRLSNIWPVSMTLTFGVADLHIVS